MIIIDFDDTIFNTRGKNGFKQNRLKALQALGVSKEIYVESYKKARHQQSVGYNNLLHAQILSQYGFDQDQIKQALETTVLPEVLKSFLFIDSLSFLNKIKNLGQPMILLSFGDKEFQGLKVARVDLKKYFDQILIVQEAKSNIVAKLVKDVDPTKVWFINNRPDETLEVKEKFPQLRYILKKSEDIVDEEYVNSQLLYFVTLTQIYEYIRDNQ